MNDLILDIQRASILFWTALKFALAPTVRYLLHLPARGLAYPVRIRQAMEELGLTYLKLGQFLAMRFDILPVEVCRELNKLFETVSPMMFVEVKTAVESELGGRLQDFFPTFNHDPLAAASVAQVHEAWTHANEHVAVKVQRPGIIRIFEADMRNLRRIAALADAFGLIGSISMKEVADEFANYTRREMDFITEGLTAERLRENAIPCEIVPEIYWDLTTSKILTMEFIEGVSLSQISNMLDEKGADFVRDYLPGLDLERSLHNLAFASLHQLFVTGFFHADPHPGNVLIREDNKVAFVDFGIFGSLTDHQREILASYIEQLAFGNINESFRYYSKLAIPTDETDALAFKREAKVVLTRWYQVSKRPDASIQERHLATSSGEMLKVLRRYRLRMSMDTLLFWRALIALDSSALRLSAHFDLLGELRDFFEQTRPGPVARVLELNTDQNRWVSLAKLGGTSPDRSSRILNDVASGRYEWPWAVQESAQRRHAKNTEARSISLAVVGISLTVLAASLHFDPRSRILIIALALFFQMFLITEMRRR